MSYLYAPQMGVTLVSICKIDTAGFASLFHKGCLRIFAPGKGRKLMGQVLMQNGLYRVEHEPEYVAAMATETVTIEKLHRLFGHIAPEKAKAMVDTGVVEAPVSKLQRLSVTTQNIRDKEFTRIE